MSESDEFSKHSKITPDLKKRQIIHEISERQDLKRHMQSIEVFSNLTPIGDPALKRALWGHIGVQWERVLSYHPANKISQIKIELRELLAMLSDCTKFAREAYGELEDLHSKGQTEALFEGQIERRIGKEFYTFVHIASSLIDLSRRYKKQKSALCPDANVAKTYDDLRREHYANTFNHLFITGMRNNLSHVILHRPSWQLSTNFESKQKSSGYVFDCETLIMRGDWKSELEDILSRREKVDVYTEMLAYFKSSKSFYDALFKFDQLHFTEAEAHLDACKGMRDALNKTSQLGIWKQVLSSRQDIDPYDYLSMYFSENEIRLIKKLPNHSREQSDLMIELADKWGIVDDQIRNTVYSIFGVKSEA